MQTDQVFVVSSKHVQIITAPASVTYNASCYISVPMSSSGDDTPLGHGTVLEAFL